MMEDVFDGAVFLSGRVESTPRAGNADTREVKRAALEIAMVNFMIAELSERDIDDVMPSGQSGEVK